MSYTVTTQNPRDFATLLLAVSVDALEIGRRIQHARTTKGWTQLDFALQAHVSPSTVQRWEAGKLPRVKELMRIAELLEVPVEHLVEPSNGDQPERIASEEVAARLVRIEQAQDEQGESLQELNEMLREIVVRLRRDEREPPS